MLYNIGVFVCFFLFFFCGITTKDGCMVWYVACLGNVQSSCMYHPSLKETDWIILSDGKGGARRGKAVI